MKSTYLQDMQAPADPDRFLAMTQVYQEAAQMPLAPRSRAGIRLTDIPMSRGMMAVVGVMRKHGDAQSQVVATMSRMMHLGEIFEAAEFFGHFILPGADGDRDGGTQVADALMRAAAVARINPPGEFIHFDLADVLAHAQRFEAAEDGEAKA
jgi:hypothetical protein